MKHLFEGRTERFDVGALLKAEERVFSIVKRDDGTVEIREECDAWYVAVLTKEEAIELFEECIAYIKGT